MKSLLLWSFLFFLLIVPTVFAGSTQQFNNIHLTPYYFETLPANTNRTMYVNINPPDGITSVLSAIFHFKAFTSGATTTYTLYINKKLCGTFLVSTTYANAGQNEIAFDCTNLMQFADNYTVEMKSSRDAGSFFGWLDLTYMNNPTSIWSGGTEYFPNENGTVFVRLMDGNDRPINLATCNATVYYPNKTFFINNQPMTLLGSGNYYRDFTLGNETGVYIVNFNCMFPSTPHYEEQYLGFTLSSGNPTWLQELYFDDTNNLTINSAWFWINTSGSGTTNIYFNGLNILSNIPAGEYNVTLNQSNFQLATSQIYTLEKNTGNPYMGVVKFYINYTSQSPAQKVRGQTELHVTFPIGLNASILGKLYKIQDEITSVNNTIKDSNSSIFGKLFNIQDEIANVNATQNQNFQDLNESITSNFNNTNTKLDWWGNFLNTTINYWGNALEAKIDGIIMGNVTVTALVDYDEIAITVMQYLKALQKQELI